MGDNKMKKKYIVIVMFLSVLLVAATEASTARFEKVVNRMVKAINEADYPGIQTDFAKVMLDAFPLEKSKPFFANMTSYYGKIQKLDLPRYTPPNQAVFPAHFERGFLDIKIVLDNTDKIVGLWFLPHTENVQVPEKNQTKLSLPFNDKWFVYWGGDNKELNYHHDTPNQKFAFDFLVKGPSGNTHKGEGKANEDYYAFGKEVLAPANGMVTDVINGVRDNKPGSMNPYSAMGNTVVIEHRKDEVSVLSHFKLGSIAVKVGDKVKKGQVIGLCGNSGNSSEPHLHYHLQNNPVIQDGLGIKCFFQKVSVTGNDKAENKINYSPMKGEIIYCGPN
jgi:murein DD-endopeptidase MepM/ murein hydrolase activator NlpD